MSEWHNLRPTARNAIAMDLPYNPWRAGGTEADLIRRPGHSGPRSISENQHGAAMTTLDDLAALARGLRDNDRRSPDIEDVRARLLRSFADRTPAVQRPLGASARARSHGAEAAGGARSTPAPLPAS